MRTCQARPCREAVVDRGVSCRRADPQMQTTRPFAGAAPVMPRPGAEARPLNLAAHRPQIPDPPNWEICTRAEHHGQPVTMRAESAIRRLGLAPAELRFVIGSRLPLGPASAVLASGLGLT